jgi:hypothetical protein
MAVTALRWFKAALLLQVLLVGYWLAIATVHVFPWNDIASAGDGAALARRLAFTLLPLLALLFLFSTGIPILAGMSVAGYAGYLAWQLWTWWKPFAMGADPAWQAQYAALHARTLKIIPALGTHLPPDAQMLTLHLLTLATLIATTMAVARMRHL